MRVCVLVAVLGSACNADGDSVSPSAPTTLVPSALSAAPRTPTLSLDSANPFYAPAGDTVRLPRITARDSGGRPMANLVVRVQGAAPSHDLLQLTTGADGAVPNAAFLGGPEVGPRELRILARFAQPVTFRYLALPAAYGGPAERACPIPATLLPRHAQLARTLAALRPGDSLRIVAIGSSSTAGTGASDSSTTYPSRLRARLRAAYPATAIILVNAGIGGQTATQMIDRFATDVFPARPQLVIWQTGTIEGTGGLSLTVFEAELRRGIAALRAAGAEVLLLDSQAYPSEPASYVQYQHVMWSVAAELDVPVVRRYETMRSYVAAGRYGWRDLLWIDAYHPNDRTYECMAHWIVAGLMAAQVEPAR